MTTMPTASSKPTLTRDRQGVGARKQGAKEIASLLRDSGTGWGEVVSDNWQAVQSLLSKPKKNRSPLFSGADVRAVVWGLPKMVANKVMPNAKLVAKSAQRKKLAETAETLSRLAERLPESDTKETAYGQLEKIAQAIVIVHGLRSIVSSCDDLQWRQLINTVESIIGSEPNQMGSSCPMIQQLLDVELPLTLGWMFEDVGMFQAMSMRAVSQMAQAKLLMDFDGMPQSFCLKELMPLIASWSRCSELIERLGLELDQDLKLQLEWVPEQFFRFLSSDKRLLLSPTDTVEISREFVEQVLSMSVEKSNNKLARASGLIAKSKSDRKSKDSNGVKLSKRALVDDVDLNCHSEWGESAVIRSGWGRKSNKLLIGFGDSVMETEFGSSCPLISGATETTVMIDDVEMGFEDSWESVSEFYDDEVSFMEFEIELNEGAAILHRQVLVSHVDSFLFLNDVVSTKQPNAKIDYQSNWPLANGIEIMPETETRELYLLRDGAIESLVLPIALPEWKVDRCPHSLSYDNQSLTLRQTEVVGEFGGGLSAPLVFDLSSKRSRKKRTWRQITVAESLEVVSKSNAVAYRVQLDKKNFVFYRSIRGSTNRTFFGENFNGEFFAGRLDKSGTLTGLVQIDL
jgi:hypothetical protein